jgi:hypothetical protein
MPNERLYKRTRKILCGIMGHLTLLHDHEMEVTLPPKTCIKRDYVSEDQQGLAGGDIPKFWSRLGL